MPTPALAAQIAPDTTALILQEIQNGVVGDGAVFSELAAAAAHVGVIPHAIRLAEAARGAAVPVIHATAHNLPQGFGVNHNARLFTGSRRAGADNAPGTASVEPVAGLLGADDLVLPRYHGLSPMTGGPLDSLLRNQGISTVVLAGVSLNVAILNLVFDAINRSYRVVVVADAVAGLPVEYGESVLHNSIALLATLASTEEVVHAWSTG